MAKANPPHSPYRVISDALSLLGSFAQLGTTLLSHKIQSTAGSANAYVHDKVNIGEIESKLSGAAAGLGHASEYALHTDVKQMVDDVALFARRHPVASLAAGIVLGTLAVRLVQPRHDSTSSSPRKVTPLKARATRRKGAATKRARTSSNGAAASHDKAARA